MINNSRLESAEFTGLDWIQHA